ncbi:PIN domain-containing protein [Pseudomonas marginalis]|uniref:PIN domain-containing protein n=1 Tax=Pseudomonas marginalis TaxID=298 RepID=UPI0039E03923
MIEAYIKQYRRKGIIVDTNLLLLALIGGTSSIVEFKRTRGYSDADYQLLLKVIDQFEKLVSTPHILAEVSNLTNGLHGNKLRVFYATLKNSLSTIIEVHHPALDISRDYELSPYGLTDVGIVAAAKDNYLVLTDDLRVAGFAHQHCVDVVNFNHIREASWEV